MKKTLRKLACVVGLAGAVMVGVGSLDQCWAATYTVSTYSEVYDIAVSNWATQASGMDIVNGVDFSWTVISPTELELWAGGNFVGMFDPNDIKALTDAAANILGIPVTDLILGSQTTSGAGSASATIVFQNVILPPVPTRAEKEKAEAEKALGMPRTFGAAIRYEKIDPENITDGDLYGLNLGMAWDRENLTFGFMLPYERLDFPNFFDADRVGLIGFGQYRQDLNDTTMLTYTAFLDYMNTTIDYETAADDDLNNYGGGLGAAVSFDYGSYVVSLGGSYQYNKDDSNTEDDAQHLLKFGANTGFRIGDTKVINFFGNWTWDITDYTSALKDDDYFEVGTELTADFTDTWSLSIGAKQLLDLQTLDSYQFYLGSIWKF